ncbi:tetratricopeptide repeat protein [Fredinandcohnia sp. QZ13]|uniref:tetratricopeptide repeat protein n=1 Tax=Fredinandcohnia sp. QZ13 TaxID=3073144 RepID=UPI0028533B93|nr:tetratricopeptide repeat protein [Fredinandcohnia sp. QZ13]MDR4889144.1 tetratricopeptide repeat protein [Fredinandcohnia sp. QZ13]
MDKQNKDKKQEKIIPFPKLKERLMEKGLEALSSKKFNEALALLEQAKELEKGNHEIELGIVICLFELGELEQAKDSCLMMLKEDVGDYFHVLQIYVTILIQLGQYDEVKSTIEAVLDEDAVPPEYLDHLTQLLELSKRMLVADGVEKEAEYVNRDVEEELQNVLYNEGIVGKQIATIQSLKELNIRKYLDMLIPFLVIPENHPIVKTIIMQLLVTNQVDLEVEVEKFGETIKVNPKNLVDPSMSPFTIRVLSILEEQLENENPTLYEMAKEIWLRHLFVLYPFTLEEEEPSKYAATLHLYSAELHGMEIENQTLEQIYGVNLFELKQTLDKLEKVERFSYIE